VAPLVGDLEQRGLIKSDDKRRYSAWSDPRPVRMGR
jgi:hypothetical protein